MDFFEMIPQATKNMVHIFATQGKSHDEIGSLTHLDTKVIDRILAEPTSIDLQKVVAAVNTTL